jgi:hypothetical protein
MVSDTVVNRENKESTANASGTPERGKFVHILHPDHPYLHDYVGLMDKQQCLTVKIINLNASYPTQGPESM